MNVKQIEELAGHRQVSPWIVKLVQEAVLLEREACLAAILARHLDDLTSESQLRGEYE